MPSPDRYAQSLGSLAKAVRNIRDAMKQDDLELTRDQAVEMLSRLDTILGDVTTISSLIAECVTEDAPGEDTP